MIPKIIHYCWVGQQPKPKSVLYCIESWKKYCPDYEIREWNETNYDFTKIKYMQQAYLAQKWGFVPDYARLDIIYEHGGIYFDTDVELRANLDGILGKEAFFGFESSIEEKFYINCGQGFGASPHNETVRKLRDSYLEYSFQYPDGTLNLTPSPHLNTLVLENLGLKRNNKSQIVGEAYIYPSDYFCPKCFENGKITITSNTMSIHHFTASWMDEEIVREIRHNQKIQNKFGMTIGNQYLLIESLLKKYGFLKLLKKGLINIYETVYKFWPLYLISASNNRSKNPEYVLLNTALESDNTGDHIIMKNCLLQLNKYIDAEHAINLPTHRLLSKAELEQINGKKKILCGTNALSGKMDRYGLWKIPRDLNSYSDILLIGVGFDSFNKKANYYTKKLFSKILSKNGIHSVRDTFTYEVLKEMGVNNVIYTGCPTMWRLTPEFCDLIPTDKAENVVFTLNSYLADPTLDNALIRVLLEEYDQVFFWPQGNGDDTYLNTLGYSNEVIRLSPELSSFENLLSSCCDLDYVGLRLHGGIHALNYRRRSVIISIDNRAEAIHRDTGLPIVRRNEIIPSLKNYLERDIKIKLKLPWENIDIWRSQFGDR